MTESRSARIILSWSSCAAAYKHVYHVPVPSSCFFSVGCCGFLRSVMGRTTDVATLDAYPGVMPTASIAEDLRLVRSRAMAILSAGSHSHRALVGLMVRAKPRKRSATFSAHLITFSFGCKVLTFALDLLYRPDWSQLNVPESGTFEIFNVVYPHRARSFWGVVHADYAVPIQVQLRYPRAFIRPKGCLFNFTYHSHIC